MRIQTPRTRSAADARSRHASIVARVLLVAMLWNTTTAQAARTASKAADKAAKTTQTAEQRQTPPATKVYRCRQADGQVLYTQHACPTTAADKVMQISDARTQEQARHSESMQTRNRKLSLRMQRERERWTRQAARHNKQAMALTLPAQNNVAAKSGKRKSDSRSTKQASRQTTPDKKGARDPKPLRPADFTARVPGSKAGTAKQRQGEAASVRASPQG